MQRKMTRRAIVKYGFMTGAVYTAVGVVDGVAGAAGTTHTPLDPNDPTAKALGFVADAAKVDAKANPTYKPAHQCSTCAQYQGKPSDANGVCNIFAGHTVPAGGWCKVYAPKPA